MLRRRPRGTRRRIGCAHGRRGRLW